MKNSTLRRAASLLLSFLVAFSLIVVSTGEANALSYKLETSSIFESEEQEVRVEDSNGDSYSYQDIIKVKSSKPKVLKAYKNKYGTYCIKGKNAGKALLTVKFRNADGEKKTIKRYVKVDKYPNFIKSIKLNGEKVDIKKKTFRISFKDYKKATAKINLTLNKGWKRVSDHPALASKTGDLETTFDYLPLAEYKKLMKGKEFKFPKKYNYLLVTYEFKKGSRTIQYEIEFKR